jgi:hypothetical protein
MMSGCEEIQLPANWLECVKSLAAGAKALIFVISGHRGMGITEELDSDQELREYDRRLAELLAEVAPLATWPTSRAP